MPSPALKTARAYLVDNVPVVSPKATVADVLTLLKNHSASFSSIAYIYLAGPDRVLVGVVSVKELFVHTPYTLIAVISKKELVSVPDSASAEEIVTTAINFNLKAVPVVSQPSGKLLGVITPDIIRDIIHDARTQDSLARAGIGSFENAKESLLSGTPLIHIRKRLPWLLLGLVGGLVAASVVRQFEVQLESQMLIVAFIPLVVYLADAVGSQTEIIFVRALALEPELRLFARFKKYAARELVVSGTLAVVLGILMSGITVYWFSAPQLASLLFISIVSTLLLSMIIALVIPYVATRLRYDPALTSGPVATVVRDVTTLLVYFYIVSFYI